MKLLCVASGVLVLHGAFASAQSRRLNDPLPRPGAADVTEDFAWSADGAHLVFRADLGVDEAFELFAVPFDGNGPPRRLNAPLVAEGDVVSFVLAGSHVVYLADQDEDQAFELYATRVSSRAHLLPDGVRKLSGPLVGGGDVQSYRVTADGKHAVFLADKRVDGLREFFRARLDGRGSAEPLDPAPSSDPITSWWVAPDGARVVHTRRKQGILPPSYVERLIVRPVDPVLAEVEIAASLSTLGYGSSFQSLDFTADGQRVVCIEQVDGKDGPEDLRLVSAPLDGSQAPVVLSQGTSNSSLPFALSPSLGRVVFFELSHAFSILPEGTSRVRLDPAGWTAAVPFAFTSDGAALVFRAATGGSASIASARLDGGLPVTVLASGTGRVQQILVSERALAYVQVEGANFYGFRALWSAPLDGSTPPVLLNGPSRERTGCGTARFAPGDRLLFTNSYSTTTITELFVVPRDGSQAPLRLSAPLSGDRDVWSFLLAPGGASVAYRADEVIEGNLELFGNDLADTAPVSLLELPGGPVVGDVVSFRASADGRSVVFQADQEADQLFRLYRVGSDGRTSPTRIGDHSPELGVGYALTPSGNRLIEFGIASFGPFYSVDVEPGSLEVRLDSAQVVGAPSFTPDQARVVYVNRDIRLASAALDGSSTIALYRSEAVSSPRLTPDGRTVVFLAEVEVGTKVELLRVPVDGSAPALRLNPPLASNRSVTAFAIAPDGLQVVYLADARTNELFELYVVALDGSRPARRLSGPLATFGDVLDFAIPPDGRRAVYRADALANGRAELFSVPLEPSTRDGGRFLPESEPDVLRLTQLAGTDAVQGDHRISVDGRQVFYRAVVAGRAELFRVPILGGPPPERVSSPDHAGVFSFELTGDKTRLVYLADRRGDGVRELYGASTSGGPVVRLDPLLDFADVSFYRVTPDSRHVVYLCDRRLDGRDELLRAPLDGSAAAETLSGPLPDGGDVQPDFLVLPGGGVVYRADQETDEVFEIFLAPAAPL